MEASPGLPFGDKEPGYFFCISFFPFSFPFIKWEGKWIRDDHRKNDQKKI